MEIKRIKDPLKKNIKQNVQEDGDLQIIDNSGGTSLYVDSNGNRVFGGTSPKNIYEIETKKIKENPVSRQAYYRQPIVKLRNNNIVFAYLIQDGDMAFSIYNPITNTFIVEDVAFDIGYGEVKTSIQPIANGNFIILSASGNYYIYSSTGEEIKGATSFSGENTSCGMAGCHLSDGKAVFVYKDTNNGGKGTFIIFNSDGTIYKNPTVCDNNARGGKYQAAALSTGGFVITTHDMGTAYFYTIYDNNGIETLSEQTVTGNKKCVTVGAMENGKFAIIYNNEASEILFDVYDSSGSNLSINNSTGAGNASDLACSSSPSGRVFVSLWILTVQGVDAIISIKSDGTTIYDTYETGIDGYFTNILAYSDDTVFILESDYVDSVDFIKICFEKKFKTTFVEDTIFENKVRFENDIKFKNVEDIVENSTHRLGDGSDHSQVETNTTHRTSNGSDHSFIDQSVVSGASPTFLGTNISQILASNVNLEDSLGFYEETTVEGALQVLGPIGNSLFSTTEEIPLVKDETKISDVALTSNSSQDTLTNGNVVVLYGSNFKIYNNKGEAVVQETSFSSDTIYMSTVSSLSGGGFVIAAKTNGIIQYIYKIYNSLGILQTSSESNALTGIHNCITVFGLPNGNFVYIGAGIFRIYAFDGTPVSSEITFEASNIEDMRYGNRCVQIASYSDSSFLLAYDNWSTLAFKIYSSEGVNSFSKTDLGPQWWPHSGFSACTLSDNRVAIVIKKSYYGNPFYVFKVSNNGTFSISFNFGHDNLGNSVEVFKAVSLEGGKIALIGRHNMSVENTTIYKYVIDTNDSYISTVLTTNGKYATASLIDDNVFVTYSNTLNSNYTYFIICRGAISYLTTLKVFNPSNDTNLFVENCIKTTLLYLNTGAGIDKFSTDGTFVDGSDSAVPTEKAVKTYTDGLISTHENLGNHGKLALKSFYATTTDDTPTNMLDSLNNKFEIPEGEVFAIDVAIIGSNFDATVFGKYKRTFAIKNIASITSLLGPVQTTGVDYEIESIGGISISANDIDSCLDIKVIGKVATSINWVATVQATKIEVP